MEKLRINVIAKIPGTLLFVKEAGKKKNDEEENLMTLGPKLMTEAQPLWLNNRADISDTRGGRESVRARRKREREKHGHPTKTPSVQKCPYLFGDVEGCVHHTSQLYIKICLLLLKRCIISNK